MQKLSSKLKKGIWSGKMCSQWKSFVSLYIITLANSGKCISADDAPFSPFFSLINQSKQLINSWWLGTDCGMILCTHCATSSLFAHQHYHHQLIETAAIQSSGWSAHTTYSAGQLLPLNRFAGNGSGGSQLQLPLATQSPKLAAHFTHSTQWRWWWWCKSAAQFNHRFIRATISADTAPSLLSPLLNCVALLDAATGGCQC